MAGQTNNNNNNNFGYHLQEFRLGNWVLTPRVLARIVGVYQRRAPWPQVRDKFGPLAHACLHACVRVASKT